MNRRTPNEAYLLFLPRKTHCHETTALPAAGQKNPPGRFRCRLHRPAQEQERGPERARRKHRRAGRSRLPALRREPPLAAAGAPRHGHRRQGRHHPSRHAGLQSAELPGHGLQAAGRRSSWPTTSSGASAVPPRAKDSSASSTARTTKTCWWSAFTISCRRKNGRAVTSGSISSRSSSAKAARRWSRCSLHISKEEQRRRLQSRLDDPKKRWKFSSADIKERSYWDDYQRAYEAVLTRCNTAYAPWYIVPANHKWYRNLIVSRILRNTLEKMAPAVSPGRKRAGRSIVE